MNSPTRLAQRVGFGPELQSYQAFSTCYKDTGLWGVYFVVDRGHHASDDFIHNVTEEWCVCVCVYKVSHDLLRKHLCISVTEDEVQRGKNLLKTQLMLALDGTTP